VFAFTGSICTMFFFPITPPIYIVGAVLAIIANTCFGASFVLLNSFLPVIVRHDPSLQYSSPIMSPLLGPSDSSHESLAQASFDSLTAVDAPTVRVDSIRNFEIPLPLASRALHLSTKISSTGIAIGYGAGVLVQLGCIILLFYANSTLFSLRLVLLIIGIWWFAFTIPAAIWLRPRPGPPLPETGRKSSGRRSWLGYVTYSWKGLYRTAKRARHLKDMLLFLAAWFMLSDGLATVSGTAVLFAKTQLEMSHAALALINVAAIISGVVGALTWSSLSKYFGLKPIHTVMACICLFELVPIYGLLGYLPIVQRWGVGGLQQPWEMYPLGVVYGFVLGGLNSYCRSLYGELIPPGSEAAFYALYAITDKGSSIFGPAIVGRITDATGEIRPAFWFLAVLIFIPLPLIALVDVERGKRDGDVMVAEYAAAEAAAASAAAHEQTPLLRTEASYGSAGVE
jgi:UMF1 family MFS transporter